MSRHDGSSSIDKETPLGIETACGSPANGPKQIGRAMHHLISAIIGYRSNEERNKRHKRDEREDVRSKQESGADDDTPSQS